MACDGHIDAREINEVKLMDKKASFFDAIDLSAELSLLIVEFKTKGTKVIEELFQTLKSNKLNTIQELLILEVALRIINADEKHDENEINFIQLLRSKLELHDETIIDRFGELEILRTNEYTRNVIKKGMASQFASSVNLPELKELEDIVLTE